MEYFPKSIYKMVQTMRWFGPKDPVSLQDLRQAGCSGVVSALHHVANGEIWTVQEITNYKNLINQIGLDWAIVESLPVHESIKTQSEGFEKHIENYKESLRNLCACGIRLVTYNFMPVLDWTRTNLSFKLKDGGLTLRLEMNALRAFDLYILNRPKAYDEYSDEEISQAKEYFLGLSLGEKIQLESNILAGLPGSEEGYTLKEFQSVISNYDRIDEGKLFDNFIYFLRKIIPLCEELGINMALHPDDPPFSIFGLPRIVKGAKDLREIMAKVPSLNNGICFCTGSFSVIKENNLLEILQENAERVHFIHLRNIRRNDMGDFYEENHLEGEVDMFEMVKEIVRIMQVRMVSIPFRPDHGPQILDDLEKKTNPGYSAIGRLKGLAEIRGLELGILRDWLLYN